MAPIRYFVLEFVQASRHTHHIEHALNLSGTHIAHSIEKHGHALWIKTPFESKFFDTALHLQSMLRLGVAHSDIVGQTSAEVLGLVQHRKGYRMHGS